MHHRSEAVGEVVRLIKIQELLHVETLDESSIPDSLASKASLQNTVEDGDLVPTEWESEAAAPFPVPPVLGGLQNTEVNLEALAGKSLSTVEEILVAEDEKVEDEKIFTDLTGFFNPKSRELQVPGISKNYRSTNHLNI